MNVSVASSGGSFFAFCPTCTPFLVSPPVLNWRTTIPGSTTPLVVKDTNLNHSTSATQVSDWQSGLSWPITYSPASSTYTSSAPSTATVSNSGYVTFVSNGTTNISLTLDGEAYTVPLTLSTQGGVVSNTFNSWVTGSLGANDYSQIETAIATVGTYSGIQIFSSMSFPTLTFVRNSGCWAYGLVGITSIAVGYFIPGYNAGTGVGITAIAPDIVMSCNHSTQPVGGVGVGTTVYWVQSDNVTVSRRLVNGGQVGSSDIHLYLLDSPLPSGVQKMKFAPSTLAASIIPGYAWGVPMFCVNGQMNPMIYWWNRNAGGAQPTIQSSVGTDSNTLNLWTILAANAAQYSGAHYGQFIAGDSGHPGALVINGELTCIMTGWTTGYGNGSGPDASLSISAINTEISNLGSASTVTVKDLSGFPTY